MADIVVFISPDFTDADKEKIAESMRIHEIETTTDPNIATAILKPSLKKTTTKTIGMVLENAPQNLTLADIAQIVIDQTRGEIFELKQHMDYMEHMNNVIIPEVSAAQTVLPKKSHHNKLRTYGPQKQQFRNTNNIRNRKIFNNLRHK